MERKDSAGAGMSPAVIVVAVIALAGLIAAVGAQGKGSHHRTPTRTRVLSNEQQQILDSGHILVKLRGTAGKRFRVDGFSGRKDRGRLTAFSKKGKAGKLSLALTGHGRQLLSGCDVDYMKVVNATKRKKRGGKKKGHPRSATLLQRNLAACQGSAPKGPTGPKCDPIDPTVCLQPWPNDYFTRADASTATGRRLDLQSDEDAHQHEPGRTIDTTDLNRADGFSPGNPIIVKVPQVSTQQAFDNSGLVPITDPGRYTDANQAAVVIDTSTGDRWPIIAELDPNPNLNQPGDTQDVNLIIRPMKNFTEGDRYIVALRNLKDASNNSVPAPESFRVFRDNVATQDPEVEARRPHMEDVLNELQTDGIPRSNLYMAWDFTVASEHSLAGRALAIRDDALAQLGDTTPGDGHLDGSAPSFHITSVLNAGDPGVPANTLREVTGELTNVPCYLNNGNCHPGGTFNFQSNGDVNATPTGTADDPDTGTTGVRFECLIPNSAVTGGTLTPTYSGIFGHGLLGDFTQVGDMIKFDQSEANLSQHELVRDQLGGLLLGRPRDGRRRARRRLEVPADGRPDGAGLREHDLPRPGDDDGRRLQQRRGVPDRSRWRRRPNPSGPVLRNGDGNLFWEGISQGAIMGGALTALEPDLTQSVLNVTGMNYSTLLRRSSDSGQYLDIANIGLWAHYPNLQQRPLILSLMQLLWDRGEANGYAEHMTSDPLPNTPAHHVLLQMAYGDHQVSNLAGEVEARTIGAQVHTPELDPGRHWGVDPFFGLIPISSYPYSGDAAMVYYDGGPLDYPSPAEGTPDKTCTDENTDTHYGTAPAPLVELPPNPASVYGCDPHSYPRRSVDGVAHDSPGCHPARTSPSATRWGRRGRASPTASPARPRSSR